MAFKTYGKVFNLTSNQRNGNENGNTISSQQCVTFPKNETTHWGEVGRGVIKLILSCAVGVSVSFCVALLQSYLATCLKSLKIALLFSSTILPPRLQVQLMLFVLALKASL